ncbi:tetratricopeptide repeat protein 1-like [Mercenaria mercenaria]|uniref:tetratricopeptide repeat protein 1-like n=1 Tax=Mercenaria mercenaria TaxID=6596 RepID=UPI00234F9A25|nr:tetratricopeptide repeat protein 1-like [Mercenaria mercenaria]XP_053406852.1 tetratricopeptide repeat protein 1-like [Mercenaria mercenaria]
MEVVNESLADRLNREAEGGNAKVSRAADRSTESGLNSDVHILNEDAESEDTKPVYSDEKQDYDNIDVTLKNENKVLSEEMTDTCTDFPKFLGVEDSKCDSSNVTVEKRTEIHQDGESCINGHSSDTEVCQTRSENAKDSEGDNPITADDDSCNIHSSGAEIEQTDDKGDNEDLFVDLSEDSGSDAEYESAEEGEEIQVDKENLQELENALTDEEKEERRNSAQTLKEEGNDLFRCGSYKSAIRTYSRALRTCPLKYAKDRAIMYSNRGACKMRLEDLEESIRDCSKALDLHPHYMKALMRRAELYEKTEKLDEALADYQKILELDPSQHTARAACVKLPDQIKERNEKLKEEMMGKLKDLGNMVLRPFGLSTNNFQMKQDPTSGGYSVNFVQNPEQK